MKNNELNKFLLQVMAESVQEIAETMLFKEITPGETLIGCRSQDSDISAVVGYNGGMNGGVRLGGSVAVALNLAGALLGEARETMDSEMEDAFGEVANMVAGGVQTRAEAKVGPMAMTPPMVVEGKHHQIISNKSLERVCHHFEMDGEVFFCEIHFSLPG